MDFFHFSIDHPTTCGKCKCETHGKGPGSLYDRGNITLLLIESRRQVIYISTGVIKLY